MISKMDDKNLEKLINELSDFFNENEIEGMKIKKFKLKKGVLDYKIIPEEPSFESCLGGGDYIEKLKEIGEKYGVENLGFANYCYHK